MFIQTETTPNPATLKFLPDRTVMADGTLEMRDGGLAVLGKRDLVSLATKHDGQ